MDGGGGADGATADGGGPDPTAVTFEMAPEPAAGPLTIWGPIVARLDEDRAVVFGGTNAGEFSGAAFDQTYLYDASGDTLEVTEIEAAGPAPRYCGCAAYDPVRDVVVMTGGRDVTLPLSVGPDTWELSLADGTWTEIAVPESPASVVGCMLAWSDAAGAMYRFGGAGDAGTTDAMHRYDPDAPAWVPLDATGPSARYDGVLQPIEDGAALLLFAGANAAMGSAFFSDVWRFDTATESWSEVIIEGPVPPGRRVPWVYLTGDESVLYAAMGYDGAMQPIGDFWYLDLAAGRWSELTLPAGLGARGFTPWLPGPGDALGTMLSGNDGTEAIREVWELRAR